MIRSTASSIRLLMSTSGPVRVSQPLGSALLGPVCSPPSCTRTPIASTPRRVSSGTYLLTASASSMNATSSTPLGVTIVGVVSVTTPMSGTFLPPSTSKTSYGGSIGLPVSLEMTLAARYGKSAPSKACSPSPKHPVSPGTTPWQAVTSSLNVPSVAPEIRRSSSVPRSNSWLPTDDASRPIASSTSMVGSSLKTLDSNGEALIRSPAPTKYEPALLPFAARNDACSCFTVAATLAAPPTVSLTSSLVPYAPSGPGATICW